MQMDRVNSGLQLVSNYNDAEEEDGEAVREETESGVDNISGSDDEGSNATPAKKPRRVLPPTQPARRHNTGVTRLVSYGADDIADDEDLDITHEEVPEDEAITAELPEDDQDPQMANYDITLADTEKTEKPPDDDVVLPPEPAGRCSKSLQESISRLYDKVKGGIDLNSSIENRKDFRNPSIYEKLITFCDIDEKGTNYPPELYDPSIWGPHSYYDELAQIQKKEMEKREKEKKERTKVDFVSGVKKVDKSGDQKRKTKWDTQPTIKPTVITATGVNPGAISSSKTVIPAVGSITKKK